MFIPPSMESRLVCGLKTDIPLAASFKRHDCSGFASVIDFKPEKIWKGGQCAWWNMCGWEVYRWVVRDDQGTVRVCECFAADVDCEAGKEVSMMIEVLRGTYSMVRRTVRASFFGKGASIDVGRISTIAELMVRDAYRS